MISIAQKRITLLVVNGIIVVVLIALSAAAFYYLHATVPIVPLIIGLAAALPLAVIFAVLHDMRLAKKAQQTHRPPYGSYHK